MRCTGTDERRIADPGWNGGCVLGYFIRHSVSKAYQKRRNSTSRTKLGTAHRHCIRTAVQVSALRASQRRVRGDCFRAVHLAMTGLGAVDCFGPVPLAMSGGGGGRMELDTLKLSAITEKPCRMCYNMCALSLIWLFTPRALQIHGALHGSASAL